MIVLPLATAGVVLGARRLRPWLVGHQRVAEIIGSVLLVIGVLLLVAYQFVGDWPYYLVATPLVLAVGGMVAAYAAGLRHAPVPARVALWLVVAAGVFWATTTVAQWSGAGLALEQAQHLDELPQVVVDTPERLYLTSPDIAETALPSVQGQKFAYRYRGWRLLIQRATGCSSFPASRPPKDVHGVPEARQCCWPRAPDIGSSSMRPSASRGTRDLRRIILPTAAHHPRGPAHESGARAAGLGSRASTGLASVHTSCRTQTCAREPAEASFDPCGSAGRVLLQSASTRDE